MIVLAHFTDSARVEWTRDDDHVLSLDSSDDEDQVPRPYGPDQDPERAPDSAQVYSVDGLHDASAKESPMVRTPRQSATSPASLAHVSIVPDRPQAARRRLVEPDAGF